MGQLGGVDKSYVLCTDPNVKIRGLESSSQKDNVKIVYSKGEYYSKEQEKILDQFMKSEKEERREKRARLVSKIEKNKL